VAIVKSVWVGGQGSELKSFGVSVRVATIAYAFGCIMLLSPSADCGSTKSVVVSKPTFEED
jgi:hypothetical protein